MAQIFVCLTQELLGKDCLNCGERAKRAWSRLLLHYVAGPEIVVLRCLIKKTQDTPDKELSIARKRLKEVLNGQ